MRFRLRKQDKLFAVNLVLTNVIQKSDKYFRWSDGAIKCHDSVFRIPTKLFKSAPYTNHTKIFSCWFWNKSVKILQLFSFKARSLSQDWINKYIPRSLYFSFRLNPEFIVVIRHNFTVLCRCEIFTEIATPRKYWIWTVKVNFFQVVKSRFEEYLCEKEY